MGVGSGDQAGLHHVWQHIPLASEPSHLPMLTSFYIYKEILAEMFASVVLEHLRYFSGLVKFDFIIVYAENISRI